MISEVSPIGAGVYISLACADVVGTLQGRVLIDRVKSTKIINEDDRHLARILFALYTDRVVCGSLLTQDEQDTFHKIAASAQGNYEQQIGETSTENMVAEIFNTINGVNF